MRILIAYPGKRNIQLKNKLKYKLVEKLSYHVPLTLTQLAALTPREYHIDILNENTLNRIDTREKYDLVALSCITQHVTRGYEVADEFRKRGIPVVMGGYHPSALPEEAKQHADAVVVGEAELTWPRLLHDFEQGTMKPFYRQEEPVDPRCIPPARRDLNKGFISAGNIQATRGCPYRCEFCSIQNVEGYKFRKRPIENVLEEIWSLKNNFFSFYDPSLTIDVEYTKDLFRSLKEVHKNFDCSGNINTLSEDEELVRLSREAGCTTWYIGFESISQESLTSVNKKNIVENYKRGINLIRKQGLLVKGLFMFGFDADTIQTFHATLQAIKEWKLDMVDFSILTPFPGTPLFRFLDQENRIFTKDWEKYNLGTVVFQPKNISPQDLLEKTRLIARNFYSFKTTSRRILEKNNLNLSQLYNKVYCNILDRYNAQKEQSF